MLAAIFYPRLPAEIAYHFRAGAPDRWLGRAAFTIWLVIPQVLFTLLSFIIVRIITLGARYWSVESPLLKKLLPAMGNMLALPGIIIIFTMLEAFLYNSYQVKLIPVWAFAVAVIVLGGIGLGILFVRAFGQAHRLYGNSRQE